MKAPLFLIAALAAAPASAQPYEPYYDRVPPPGSYAVPKYPPPGDYAAPEYPSPDDYAVPEYPPPPPYRRHIRFGQRCDALLQTRRGPARVVCPIVRAKPIGMECACPSPEGVPSRRFIPGRTIR